MHEGKRAFVFITIVLSLFIQSFSYAQKNLLSALQSPILFKGNDSTAYRDPAVLYNHHQFYLFFTLVQTEAGKVYSYTAMSQSKNLRNWSEVKKLTPKNQSFDYSSPGNIIHYKNEWILCMQTYPRPDYTADQMPRFGNGNARLYIMRSKDLQTWSDPELLKVKGDNISFEAMGRMIDPYLLQDKDDKQKWWCFYKQNGVSKSYTFDFVHWTYAGHTESGENVCVLPDNNEYLLFHSPKNGIAIKRSMDLVHWKDWENVITLGQQNWSWAKGRITAGAVIKLNEKQMPQPYIMFFHGSGPLTEEQGDFDKNASIGIAWSDELIYWNWPSKNKEH